MPYYRVNFQAVASAWVDVEAEDEEAAFDAACGDLPYAPGFSNYEFGEWSVSSEFQRALGDPHASSEWDIEEIDEETFSDRNRW